MAILSVEVVESQLQVVEQKLQQLGYAKPVLGLSLGIPVVDLNTSNTRDPELFQYQCSPCPLELGSGYKTNSRGEQLYSVRINHPGDLNLGDVLPSFGIGLPR